MVVTKLINVKDINSGCLNQVGHVHWHFVYLRRVVLLDVPKYPDVVGLDEIDRHTLATEPTRPAYSVDVQLTVVRQIVVYD